MPDHGQEGADPGDDERRQHRPHARPARSRRPARRSPAPGRGRAGSARRARAALHQRAVERQHPEPHAHRPAHARHVARALRRRRRAASPPARSRPRRCRGERSPGCRGCRPRARAAPSQPSISVSVTPMAICASCSPISGSASTSVARNGAAQDCGSSGLRFCMSFPPGAAVEAPAAEVQSAAGLHARGRAWLIRRRRGGRPWTSSPSSPASRRRCR